MFGYRGDETPETVTRKKGHMKDAQAKWSFLTNFDCSTITTPGQLAHLVKTRTGGTEAQAKRDVEAWMDGRTF